MTFYMEWKTFSPGQATPPASPLALHLLNLQISHGEGEFPVAIFSCPVGLLESALEAQKDRLPKEGAPFAGRLLYEDKKGERRLIFAGYLRPLSALEEEGWETWEMSAESLGWKKLLSEAQQALKIKPFWEPLVVPPESRDDLDEILDARFQLPHCHRCTGALSFSSALEGREILFLPNIFQGSVQHITEGPGLSSVSLEVQVCWHQRGQGVCDLGPVIAASFAGSLLSTLTPHFLLKNWWSKFLPLAHTGYEILESKLEMCQPPETGGLQVYPPESVPFLLHSGQSASLKRFWMKPTFVVGWQYHQKRSETLHIYRGAYTSPPAPAHPPLVLKIQLQDVCEAGFVAAWQPERFYRQGEETSREGEIYRCLAFHMSAQEWAQDEAMWKHERKEIQEAFDPASPSFFSSKRGSDVVSHMVQKADTYLKASLRKTKIRMEIPFEDALPLSCDHTVEFDGTDTDGSFKRARGKVVSYTLSADAQTGDYKAEVLVALVQQGQPLPPYRLELLSQRSTGAEAEDPRLMEGHELIESVGVFNRVEEQNQFLSSRSFQTVGHARSLLEENPTRLKLRLKNLKKTGVKSLGWRLVWEEGDRS